MMKFPTRSPYTDLALFFAVLLSFAAGGFYLSKSFQSTLPQATTCIKQSVHPEEVVRLAIPPPVENHVDNSEIFKVAEQMPIFPGIDCGEIKNYRKRKKCGEKAMLEYIYSRVKYPENAREHGVEGMAVVTFVVEKNGVITNIKVVRDPGMGLGEAAAKTVRYMKADNIRWEPGLQRGKPVRFQFNLPVKFKLQ